MGEILRLGNPLIEVDVRRSARARRMSLRVSRLDGQVTLTIPRHASLREAERFAASKGDWLAGHIETIEPAQVMSFGGSLPFQGKTHTVVPAEGRRVRIKGTEICVPAGADPGAKVKGFLKARARDTLAEASDRYAAMLGRTYARLTLRDPRSRWGSCTSDGGLMFSWRLIMAPPEVLDYVAAHEVAHLVEMNHSADFWDVVERLMPDYAAPRRWLRTDGPALHRLVFD